MAKLENGRMKTVKIKRFAAALVVIIILSGLIFYFSGKLNGKKTIATVARVTNNIIKDTNSKPTTPAHMNLRESKVNTEEPSTDASTIDVYKPNGHKIAYLTFDDGPSPNTTTEILKTLDKYNIKATFFIIGSLAVQNPNLVKMEVKDGQAIGNHTYSHNYQYIYSNTNTFISDINKCDDVLKSIIGKDYNSKLVRFPGGSFGIKMAPFRESLKNSGHHFIDWNDLTGDAEGQNIPVNKLLNNLKTYTRGKEHAVILMHDTATKKTTVQALPQVIEYLKSQGYSFNTLK